MKIQHLEKYTIHMVETGHQEVVLDDQLLQLQQICVLLDWVQIPEGVYVNQLLFVD